MRRIVVVGVLVGIGFLVVRARGHRPHQGMMARCEQMFDRMPDDFPPKRMVRGIEETRVNSARTVELLEARESRPDETDASVSVSEAIRHAT